MKWFAGGLVAALLALMGVSLWQSRPLFDDTLDPAILDDVAIAPTAEALTFARVRSGGRHHVLLVGRYRDARVTAIDLTARLDAAETDPLALLRRVGYDALAQEAASIANVVVAKAAALDLPFDAPEHNIGVGLNYAEHARESTLDELPFVFPKLALPTRADSEIAKGDSTLLDYEAEIGLVALDALAGPELPQRMGLVLANEVTDRWPLVRNFDGGREMGTTGFADGKSRAGFAPLGPLLVVPRDFDRFYRQLEMRLYLNGRLRQHETAGNMIWGPRQIVSETFRRAGWEFAYRGGTVPLLNAGAGVAAGTIFFSGTPGGVIFRPLNVWNRSLYLKPGDEVVIRADYLGVIRNRIVD